MNDRSKPTAAEVRAAEIKAAEAKLAEAKAAKDKSPEDREADIKAAATKLDDLRAADVKALEVEAKLAEDKLTAAKASVKEGAPVPVLVTIEGTTTVTIYDDNSATKITHSSEETAVAYQAEVAALIVPPEPPIGDATRAGSKRGKDDDDAKHKR